MKTSPLASRGLRGVGQVLFWAFTATIVAIAILVYIIPQAKAGSGLTVLTGSMRPTYDPGDVVAVKGIKAHEVCDSVKPGQVVTFMPNADDQTLITHRVVAVSARTDYEECTVTTRGDANNVDDEPVPAKAVKGVVMYRVPFVGKVINKMHQNADERNVAVGGAAMFGAAALWFISPYKRKAREPEWNI
ncbi:MAG: signal peptidase I [Micrococcales bacterium]|nr:signal peptidase I [Micrococcales bacterium]MCL2667554.1 signal peptidase I [Micrococcales bacterium]